jgi:hypothetical protein
MWPGTANSGDRRSPQASAGTPNNTREPARSDKKKPQPRTVGVLLLGLGATESLRQALVFKRIFVCANELVPPSVPPNFFATPKNQVNVRLYFA